MSIMILDECTLLIHVIMIISYVPSLVRCRVADSTMEKDIPNAWPSSLRLDSAFSLVGSACDTPPEAFWELPALILLKARYLLARWERTVEEPWGGDQL